VQPGAFTILGVETAGRDEEYSITGTSMLPVTARLVHENEEDYEHLEEQLHQQGEQLRQQYHELEQLQRIVAERENVAIAQVIA